MSNSKLQELTILINTMTGFFRVMLKKAPDGNISLLDPAWLNKFDFLRSRLSEAHDSFIAANQPTDEIDMELFHEAADSYMSVCGSWLQGIKLGKMVTNDMSS